MIVLILAAGTVVALVVVLLGLLIAGAPDCSASTPGGKAAHRVAGGTMLVGVVALGVTVAIGIARARRVGRRIVLAALPLVLAPLLAFGASVALNAGMEALGDDGSGSCF